MSLAGLGSAPSGTTTSIVPTASSGTVLVVGPVVVSASPASPVGSPASSAKGGQLARLVLGVEGCQGLVQVGGDGCYLHRSEGDLLGGLEDFVSGLEYLFVGGTGELHVAYMGPNVHW